MKLADLSPATLDKINALRWDRIIEKHEGPEDWDSTIEYLEPDFLNIEGRWVLLPIAAEHHQNVTIIRTIWGDDENTLTLFLKDSTYYDDPFFSGFLAVADRLPGEDFYVAIAYHEWFIIDGLSISQ
jgi:hypothetical protein